MFIWGLVLAKARTGFSASNSKDASVVSGSMGKMIGMSVLILLASLAKLNADHHYVENWMDKTKSGSMKLNSMVTEDVASDVTISSDLL